MMRVVASGQGVRIVAAPQVRGLLRRHVDQLAGSPPGMPLVSARTPVRASDPLNGWIAEEAAEAVAESASTRVLNNALLASEALAGGDDVLLSTQQAWAVAMTSNYLYAHGLEAPVGEPQPDPEPGEVEVLPTTQPVRLLFAALAASVVQALS